MIKKFIYNPKNLETKIIRKNTLALVYEADEDGSLYNEWSKSNMFFEKGDYIACDPENLKDIWVIKKELKNNYSEV